VPLVRTVGKVLVSIVGSPLSANDGVLEATRLGPEEGRPLISTVGILEPTTVGTELATIDGI